MIFKNTVGVSWGVRQQAGGLDRRRYPRQGVDQPRHHHLDAQRARRERRRPSRSDDGCRLVRVGGRDVLYTVYVQYNVSTYVLVASVTLFNIFNTSIRL